ncbi:MAG: hypothetical protein HY526_04125 [Betaproteobacteria bacterium]|nr:hypothetical protein [Betaproteobacteria bacterium]
MGGHGGRCVSIGGANAGLALVRVGVPFPAGGGTDIVARMVTQKLGEAARKAILVDNPRELYRF